MAHADPFLGRRRVVQVSLESTKGGLVTGATHILCYEPEINPTDDTQLRQASGSALGNFASVVGARVGTCRLRTEVRAVSGAATAALDAGILIMLQGCGFTLTAGPPNVLAPTNNCSAMKTITIALNEGEAGTVTGRLKQLTGCMGNARIIISFGKPLMLECDFTGVWNAPSAQDLPTAVINTQLPFRSAGVTFTLGGSYTPRIPEAVIDLGNKITMVEDISQAAGVLHAVITDRDPTMTMSKDSDLIANYDPYALWLAGTEAALSMAFTNGTRGITIAAPKLQHRAPQTPSGTERLKDDITAELNVSDLDTGGDELTLTVM